ncbi:MAG: methionine--tRNA ligase, partial [Christensenellales bacterium]
YTTVICDAIARFKRMAGYDVFYLTGTDEHGQKVEEKAKAAGTTPKQFVDGLYAEITELWKLLDISFDKFIRTTDAYHEAAVQKIFKILYEKGDLYKSEYEGMYCTPCESFWTKSQLNDGKCPDCGREVKLMKEESYFFRLSKYQDRLMELYTKNPNFISPKSRMNEMINNFIKPGLKDLCVSRTSFKWGVPVTFDEKHVIYVWIDALSNYITALGYQGEDDSLFKKYWPADLHMVGKEIVRFHTIIWPAILMALDLPLPAEVYGHGWLLFGGDKMSKSKGNAADPFLLSSRYGVDAVRYYLLREVPFGSDGMFTNELFLKRINTDLANVFGNLVSRTIAMIIQYFDGIIPAFGDLDGNDASLIETAEQLLAKVKQCIDELDAPAALENIFALLNKANKYIDDTAPWVLFKNGDRKRLATVLYNLAETIRFAAVALQPFLTNAPALVFEGLGVPDNLKSFESLAAFGALPAGSLVKKIPPIFNRVDIKKELAELEAEEAKAQAKKAGEKPSAEPAPKQAGKEEIGIDEFLKAELKTAKIIAAERVEGRRKLLKLTLDEGGATRTVVSGIAEFYKPEELVGKSVVFVANLKPATIAGIESRGMILCAEGKAGLAIVSPDGEIEPGSGVR